MFGIERSSQADPTSSSARTTRRLAVVLGVVAALLAVAIGGIAYAGYRFARQHEGRILPGASVAGVDVGGASRAQALSAVRSAISDRLDRPIEIAWGAHVWTVTPRELGARSDARAAVGAALSASEATSFIRKTSMSLFDRGLDFEREVAITYPRRGAQRFLVDLAARFDRKARDASLDASSGWVEFEQERTGRRVRIAPSRRALMAALTQGSDRVSLVVSKRPPEVTLDDLSSVLLVRIGENKLYLYRDGKIERTWTVATGLPEYPTPTGVFEIGLKRFMPTWVNPAPDTWGKDLPASIGPGASNPLGLRALNWSAPAIRFHGTTNIASLGHQASHGCVRMSNADVIELYDLVDVGTTIVSVNVGGGTTYRGTTTAVDLETTAENR